MGSNVGPPLRSQIPHGAPLQKRATWGSDLSSGHKRGILIACSLVSVPMLAFTLALLSIVFSSRVNLRSCQHPDLCYDYNSELFPNATSNYYVDFAAGRLAFVSSLSSTVSFTLIAVLMTIYGFIVSRQILEASRMENNMEMLPRPYEFNLLVRLLNAEIFLLWPVILSYFSPAKRARQASPRSRLVRQCLLMFFLCLAASILVQIADTYLHIVIEGVSAAQVHLDSKGSYSYGRTLAPWCFEAGETTGTYANRFFWGCSVAVKNNTLVPLNRPRATDIATTIESYSSEFTDSNGEQFAVIHAPDLDPNVDWIGSSFGVSTRCSAVPQNECEMGRPSPGWKVRQTFNCPNRTLDGTPTSREVSGNLTFFPHSYWLDSWHTYMQESAPPFTNSIQFMNRTNETGPRVSASEQIIANTTLEDSAKYFKNRWNWIAQVLVTDGIEDALPAYKHSELVWKVFGGDLIFLLTCQTAVWDVQASFMGGKIQHLKTTPSNGTVAGIVSMPFLNSLDWYTGVKGSAQQEANVNRSTPDEFVSRYERAMNKILASSLAVGTENQPVKVAQRRVTKIITELPVLALWLLVTANLLFTLLGLVLTVLALNSSTAEVYQVHTRLTTAGLAAQLLDRDHSVQEARDEKSLFKAVEFDEGSVKSGPRVVVLATEAGGAEFLPKDVRATGVDHDEKRTGDVDPPNSARPNAHQ